MLNVVVACKEPKTPAGLEYIPWPYRLELDSRPGWALASNVLLDRAAVLGGDVLFLDDDAILTPDTFGPMRELYDRADVFGFRLTAEDGAPVSFGYELHTNGLLLPRRDANVAAYCAHVTTSAIYLKQSVVRAGVRFPVWPGIHSEDVAFTFDCWLAGFSVLYTPGTIIHPLHEGVGRTKKADADLSNRLAVNAMHLQLWMRDRGVMEAARRGIIPFGSAEVEAVHGR